MKFSIGPLQIGPMKHSMQVAGIVAGIMALAGMNVHAARDHRRADVTVYVDGARFPPNLVDCGARTTVTRMYAHIGVRIDWRIGSAARDAASGSPVSIQMRYAGDNEGHLPVDSLAFALPFTDGTPAITVMYDRIQFVAGRSGREQAILAHVLAHEIGHVLQRTNQHSQTGVMKAHWNGHDHEAMGKKPLEFTHDDVDLIEQGLNALKARVASEHEGDAIMRPPASGRK